MARKPVAGRGDITIRKIRIEKHNMTFDLQLTEEKIKRHQVTAMHLTCALAFIAAGAIIVVYNYTIPYWGLAELIAGILLLGVTMIRNKWVTGKNSAMYRIGELAIAAAMAGYSATQHWTFPIFIFTVLTLAVAFAMFWERASSNAAQVIHIDDTGIKLPVTSRKRFIDWLETDSVILRYGTLSIECTDNRLYQWNVKDIAFKGEELEQFCTRKIEEYKSKRVTDEW